MQPELFAFKSEVLPGITQDACDDAIEDYLKNHFHEMGKIVSVEKVPFSLKLDGSMRQFIVVFQSKRDAIHFAKVVHQKIFGQFGVIISLPEVRH